MHYSGDDPFTLDDGIDCLDKVASHVRTLLFLLRLHPLFDLVLVGSEFKYSIYVE